MWLQSQKNILELSQKFCLHHLCIGKGYLKAGKHRNLVSWKLWIYHMDQVLGLPPPLLFSSSFSSFNSSLLLFGFLVFFPLFFSFCFPLSFPLFLQMMGDSHPPCPLWPHVCIVLRRGEDVSRLSVSMFTVKLRFQLGMESWVQSCSINCISTALEIYYSLVCDVVD